MSMTYYAVTDDPNELAHFGIKGMKWGVRHDKPRHSGSRRRSAAYKRASGKLSKLMKSGIKKAEANWKTYNSPQAKEQRFMNKAMQKARNGTLKYGKLTDAQVRRVTERLALERNARQLGNTENPRFVRRLGSAVGEGIIRGIGQGTSSYIDERFRGRGRVTAEIKGEERKARREAGLRGQRAARRKAKNELNREYYKTSYEEGNKIRSKVTAKKRAEYLAEVKERNKLSDTRKKEQDAFNTAYQSNLGKHAAEWVKNHAGESNDYKQAQAYPRLPSASNSYPVNSSTYKPPETNTVIYVDSRGVARKRNNGRRK